MFFYFSFGIYSIIKKEKKGLFLNGDYMEKTDLQIAKINYWYHKKNMEFYKEEIKIIKILRKRRD